MLTGVHEELRERWLPGHSAARRQLVLGQQSHAIDPKLSDRKTQDPGVDAVDARQAVLQNQRLYFLHFAMPNKVASV